MLRREFVKYLTAGAAGQFILPVSGASAATPLNVVVIGGGMAGATAAKYLRVWARKLALDALVSVTIIDKSDQYVSNIMSNMVLTGEKTIANLTYTYASLKTKYGINFIKATVSSVDTANGWVYGKLNNTGSDILLNATPFNRLILATGISFDPSTFTLNVPSTVYANPWEAIPHAWQAGTQTTLLRNQLVNMTAGNHVAVTIPVSPYRCPPGPYERACVLADWLRVKKPGSKIYLIDPGQTADGRPPVEPNNFGYAFANIHKNLVYVQNARLTAVTGSLAGTTKFKTLSLVPNSATPLNTVNALASPTAVKVEVANVIPKMQAADLTRSVLGPAGLDADGRWAVVDERSYKSLVPKVYVIGDSIKSANQPKAGHIGNQQAKVCADAILRELSNVALYDAPVTNSACFTPVTTNLNSQYGAMASWLTATFRYGVDPTDNVSRMLRVSTNIESPGRPSKDNFSSMGKWFTSLMQDVYS
ncbi:FAD-dependent oxidoreductase [Aestuariivirga litoralis]|nr:FAD/NAD(P)-binding oxidoreductase [Aestuariivirga litoralis]